MSRILTVTLNPALDLSTETGTIVPQRKLRCAAPDASSFRDSDHRHEFRFINRVAFQKVADIGIQGASDARQRPDRWRLPLVFDFGEITFGQAGFLRHLV